MSENKIWDMEMLLDKEGFDYIEHSINCWREWITRTVSEVEKTEVQEIKLLTYFSILEMMAQEYYNFPQGGLQDLFAKFVLKFQSGYDFLEDVDPITLYYREEKHISSMINLNNLVDGEIYYPNSEIILDKASEIKKVLINYKGEAYTQNKLKQHRYVELLYRMRCRLSHEFSAPNVSKSNILNEPNYINCSRQYVSGGNLINDDVWKLRFPITFVKDLCLNCFENFMSYCLKERISPNENNGFDRFCELSWYSR